ncbi:MAG: class I SAM-dependent methyltransferase [Candidatus Njordarchaeales archaeon]
MLAVRFPLEQIVKGKQILMMKKVLNKRFRYVISNYQVYFPVINLSSDQKEFIQSFGGEILEVDENFFPKKTISLSLKDLEKKYKKKLPKSVTILGDILLINQIEEDEKQDEIGEIFRRNFGVRAVFLKIKETGGEYRTAQWKRIAGFGSTLTIHKEGRYYFIVDVSKVFFNPRLGNERNRVISQIKGNEIVIDMFSGVGSFSIPIAKKASKVYAIDINPHAIDFLKMNMKINKVDPEKLIAIIGDSKREVPRFGAIADRIIMNYPEGSFEFIEAALRAINQKGVIHLYNFCRAYEKNEAINNTKELIEARLGKLVSSYKILFSRIVEDVAPRKFMVVNDIFVKI